MSLSKNCEQWIAESLGLPYRNVWELCSVMPVEELPNRNCFRITSVVFLCVIVLNGEDGCHKVGVTTKTSG